MRSQVLEEDKPTVRNIAQGLYTKWQIDRPKSLERILDSLSLRTVTRSYNDTEMKVDTGSTVIEVTTYQDRIILHSIQLKDLEKSIDAEEVFKLREYKSKKSYINDFTESWYEAVNPS